MKFQVTKCGGCFLSARGNCHRIRTAFGKFHQNPVVTDALREGTKPLEVTEQQSRPTMPRPCSAAEEPCACLSLVHMHLLEQRSSPLLWKQGGVDTLSPRLCWAHLWAASHFQQTGVSPDTGWETLCRCGYFISNCLPCSAGQKAQTHGGWSFSVFLCWV